MEPQTPQHFGQMQPVASNELHVYSRRKKKLKKRKKCSQLIQTMNPFRIWNLKVHQVTLLSAPTLVNVPVDDRPIAIRNGKRSCTDHLIYNFISYRG